MTKRDKTSLKNEINTLLPDNSSGQISPSDVRLNIIDTVDSMAGIGSGISPQKGGVAFWRDEGSVAYDSDFVWDSGNVRLGIGKSPNFQLELSQNSAGKPTSTLWSVVSDDRIKREIETIEDGLEKIDKLRPVRFKFVDSFCRNHNIDTTHHQTGFLASEYEKVFPCGVIQTNINVYDDDNHLIADNIKALDAHDVGLYLVAAVKELKQRLDAANEKISELESKIGE